MLGGRAGRRHCAWIHPFATSEDAAFEVIRNFPSYPLGDYFAVFAQLRGQIHRSSYGRIHAPTHPRTHAHNSTQIIRSWAPSAPRGQAPAFFLLPDANGLPRTVRERGGS